MRMFFDQSNIDPSMGCGDEETYELAESIVCAYTVDELKDRIPDWYNHMYNHCTAHDQWWTDVNEFLTDAEMDDYWDQIVADGSVYRLVLAYLIARKGRVWESFLEHYSEIEAEYLNGDQYD